MNKLKKIHSSSVPAHYDPIKGLKKVAKAEAEERFWQRAKDVDKLYEAVDAKITEQRNFVLWWDSQKKDEGGRPSKTRPSTVTGLLRKDLPVDRMTLHRWRIRYKDSRKFDEALLAAQDRCRRVCEIEKGGTEQKGASGTGENEWYTPAEYIERARIVLGKIDLDPASSKDAQAIVKASSFFSKAINGLTQEWTGCVWLNPPYAQPLISQFIEKLTQELTAGHIPAAILLTHNYTDTAWFHLAASMCNAICFTRGRVKFVSSDGNIAAPTQGQAFFYFGPSVTMFGETFAPIGFVMVPHE